MTLQVSLQWVTIIAACPQAEGSVSGSKRPALALPAPPSRKAAVSKPAPKSCLDWLWEAVAAGGRLRAEQPAMLAHTLRALLAMWQVRRPGHCTFSYINSKFRHASICLLMGV